LFQQTETNKRPSIGTAAMSSSIDDIGAMLQTAVFVGTITALLYFLVLRKRPNQLAPTAAQPAVRQAEKPASLPKSFCTRVPSHISEMSAKITHSGGSNVLSDGIVAFRHTKVASHEACLPPDLQMKNRKDRARILSNFLSDTTVSSPPMKGGAVVVSVPVNELECLNLRRVLYLLATYYSLLVIVTVDPSFTPKDLKEILHKLRGSADEDSYLAPEVLPDHRVTASSSVTGRVAFVRQLQRIELVLDYDEQVRDNLTRFGHRVILYGNTYDPGSSHSTSRLGTALL
jgi:hypothetical protein